LTLLKHTYVVSIAQIVPVVWSDVFTVDDVSEGKDDVRAHLDVDMFWRETRVSRTLLCRDTVVAEQCLRRTSLPRLLMLLAGSH